MFTTVSEEGIVSVFRVDSEDGSGWGGNSLVLQQKINLK
jgi:hypothetical protein